ncbi:hypothetical protein SM124_13905 [Bacillus sp. 31A1R]|uniref:YhfM-like domain-containing protein n=1 Tax=Robertmurraya mangrovi TaxID=3098077 RepID=A0ABU5J0F2_9BACI|nr:hypothetical protein [Bacillus sp. 31A1R]MDZ5472822.1 hypothetical protein [Bacillus sp. 31A1R]
MKFKLLIAVLCLLISTILSGCLNQKETMVLLDEKIQGIEVSKSMGVGNVNEDIHVSFNHKNSIKVFEKAIKSAIKDKVELKAEPDYDIVVSYGDEFPKHAVHLWLGKENEESILTYMVGEGETYRTSAKITNQLRELILTK